MANDLLHTDPKSSIGASGKANSESGPLVVPVRVLDIILDSSHPKFEDLGSYDSIGTIFYGVVQGSKIKNNDKATIENRARPLFQSIKQYPLKNEIVILLDAPSKLMDNNRNKDANTKYYLPNVNIWNHTHTNALPNMQYFNKGEEEAKNYGTIGATTVRIAEGDGSVEVPLGKYFKEKLQTQPLLPFEGDTIIEGRFGNSIRFGATAIEAPETSAYSTKGETGDPITIIRNGALVEEEDKGWEHTLENINSDHSTIYLTSNQILPNLKIITPNWDSWLVKHDALDVGDAKDDFDNIFRGAEPEVLEIQETPEDKEEAVDEKETFAQEEINEDNSEEFPKEKIPKIFKYGWNDSNRSEISIEAQDEEPGEWDPNAENNSANA